MDGDDEQEAAEAGPVAEELEVGLRGILVLVLDRVADLIIFGTHPGVLLIAVRVQSRQRPESLLWLAVVDEPAWRFGEEHDEQGEDTRRYDLDAEADAPLHRAVIGEVFVASKCRPRGHERPNA